ncbi:putative uncharacterized protein, partial [Helicobacter pylori]
NQRNQFRSV